MAYNPFPTLTKKLQPYGTSATVGASPGYTQQQVIDSLAANPNAAGNPNGMYPMFGSSPSVASMDSNPVSPTFGTSPANIDWTSLIQNDPAYKQTLADMKAANVADLGSRNAAFNRAIINFGQVPDMQAAQQALGLDLGSVIDPQTAQLAQQNQYSTEANLQHSFQQGIMKLRQALAARGALQSGELGYQLGEANRSFGNAQNSATQQLLDALSGYQSQYTNAVNGRQASSTQALLEALTRVLSQYGNTGGGYGGGGGGGGGTGTSTPPPPPPPTAAPSGGTVAQNIQNYGIGQNPQQRVNFIGL